MHRATAYRVPFELRRDVRPQVHRLVNVSLETVHGVSLTLHGHGMLSASLPAVLVPGEGLDLTVRGRDLARATIMVVRWFRPSGVEYLWRVSF